MFKASHRRLLGAELRVSILHAPARLPHRLYSRALLLDIETLPSPTTRTVYRKGSPGAFSASASPPSNKEGAESTEPPVEITLKDMAFRSRIAHAAKNGNAVVAVDAWRGVQAEGLVLDEEHSIKLMNVCLNATVSGTRSEAGGWGGKKPQPRREGPTPTLTHEEAKKLLNVVFAVFEALAKSGQTPSEACYNTVSKAFGQAGNARAAKSAEAVLKARGEEPSDFFRANLITAYCRSGDVSKASQMYKDAMAAPRPIQRHDRGAEAAPPPPPNQKDHETPPTQHLPSPLLSSPTTRAPCSTPPAPARAGFVGTPSMYSSLATGLSTKCFSRKATSVAKDMIAAGYTPSPHLLSMLLDAALCNNDARSLEEVLGWVASSYSGVTVDRGSLLQILEVAAIAANVGLATQAWNLAFNHYGFQPCSEAYGAMVHCFGKARDDHSMLAALMDLAASSSPPLPGSARAPNGQRFQGADDERRRQAEALEGLVKTAAKHLLNTGRGSSGASSVVERADGAYFLLKEMHLERARALQAHEAATGLAAQSPEADSSELPVLEKDGGEGGDGGEGSSSSYSSSSSSSEDATAATAGAGAAEEGEGEATLVAAAAAAASTPSSSSSSPSAPLPPPPLPLPPIGRAVHVSGLNAVLLACAQAGGLDRAFGTFEELSTVFNLRPTQQSFHALLEVCAQQRAPQPGVAMAVLEDMKTRSGPASSDADPSNLSDSDPSDLSSNLSSPSSSSSSSSVGGDDEDSDGETAPATPPEADARAPGAVSAASALSLADEVEPDAWSYHWCILSLAYANLESDAEDLLERMGYQGLDPLPETRCQLTHHYINKRDFSAAEVVMRELDASGHLPKSLRRRCDKVKAEAEEWDRQRNNGSGRGRGGGRGGGRTGSYAK